MCVLYMYLQLLTDMFFGVGKAFCFDRQRAGYMYVYSGEDEGVSGLCVEAFGNFFWMKCTIKSRPPIGLGHYTPRETSSVQHNQSWSATNCSSL